MINANKYQFDSICKKVNLTKFFNRWIFCLLFLTLALPILSSAAIPADPNGSFRFIAWADSRGSSSGVNTAVLTSLSNTANTLDPAFTIFSGDLCYSFSTSCINDIWKPALNGNNNNGMLSKTFVARGNHDNGNLASWQGLWDFSTLANSVGATNYFAQSADATYSFDYGNSHFVVIDLPGGGVNSMTTTQITWLNSDLTGAENRLGTTLKHEFIFWHGPVYTVTSSHGSEAPSTALKNVLSSHPLISAGFFGHDHVTVYAHIDNSCVSGITNDFEEFTIGRAGAPAYSVSKPVDFSDNSNAFAAVDVSGNDYTVSIYRSSGSVAYTNTFTESGITPKALSVSISESPDSVTSGGTSEVTVHVTSDGSNVNGATVGVSVTDGSLSLASGTTNANGDFIITYTAPTVKTSTTYTISATASKTGYTSGSGTDQITVNPEFSELVISNIAAATGKAYVLDKLANSKFFYIDRTYMFTNVPSSYVGLDYIRTAIDDRFRTDTAFLQFDISQPAIVYVAYDDRISSKPSWLTSSFTDTGSDVMRDGTYRYSIYSRAYLAGHVSLGGNSVPSGGAGGMYVIIVKPSGTPLPSTLAVSISEFPDPVTSGGTSEFIIHVTSGGSNVDGANVYLSVTDGSLSLASGTTNANGDFIITYTAPTVTTSTTNTISATASKTGYTSGSGTDQITVNPESSELVISNIEAVTGKAYIQDTLSVGKLFYIDRTYKFTGVPPSYIGLKYIRTATDDRQRTESNFLQFDVNKDVTVFVAYDDRISPKASWLSSFTDTGDNVMRDSLYPFSIYARDYPAGHVSLGGTSYPGNFAGSYVVIVKPLASPPPTSLGVSISESPDPVTSGGTSEITVHVTSGGNNVNGATAGVSVTEGSLSLASGTTNANGDFIITYTAPTVTTSTTNTISATASKTGYTSGSGTDQITVNPESSELVISNIVAASGKTYIQDTLAVGKLFYIDRTYKFTGVSPSYIGLKYIRTATDDRQRTESNFLQFDVNKDVTVYITYDDRISPKASWLSSFTNTGDNVMRDSLYPFSIYARDYPAGHVSLGGTSYPGNFAGSYVVIVKTLASPPPTSLGVSISESSDPVNSGGISEVTVHVTSGESNVDGANNRLIHWIGLHQNNN